MRLPHSPDVYRLSGRADEGTRTPDRLITNQLLYQLSYIGFFYRFKQLFSRVLRLQRYNNFRKGKIFFQLFQQNNNYSNDCQYVSILFFCYYLVFSQPSTVLFSSKKHILTSFFSKKSFLEQKPVYLFEHHINICVFFIQKEDFCKVLFCLWSNKIISAE